MGLRSLHGLLRRENPRAGLVHSGFGGTLLDLRGPNSVLGDLQFFNRAHDEILGPRLDLGGAILRAPDHVGGLIDEIDRLGILVFRRSGRNAPEAQNPFGWLDRRLAANVISHMFSEPLHMVLRLLQRGFPNH